MSEVGATAVVGGHQQCAWGTTAVEETTAVGVVAVVGGTVYSNGGGNNNGGDSNNGGGSNNRGDEDFMSLFRIKWFNLNQSTGI